MAITSAGYYGTVSDAQWAQLFEPLPHWFRASSFVPSAVGGQRRVSLTAGVAFGAGVRDVSDSAATIDLTPPSSGGQWFLIVIRRTWSIGVSGTTTIQALAGATTSGTAGAVPSTLPGSFQQTPSATDDAPIAWVHVRAADTTLTVVDARMILSANGGGVAASISALAALQLITTVTYGLLIGSLAEQVTYRWNGTAWKPWDSDWIGYTPDVQGLLGSLNASPGFVTTGRYRYRAGRVVAEMRGYINGVGGGNGNAIAIALPINRGSTDLGAGDIEFTPSGRALAYDASASMPYDIGLNWVNNNYVRLVQVNGGGAEQAAGTNTPFVWAQSDVFSYNIEYDPA